MRIFMFGAALLSVTLFGACQSDKLVEESVSQHLSTSKGVQDDGVQIVVSDGMPTLQFRDESCLLAFEERLSALKDEEKIALVKNLGFSSYYSVYKDYDNQLEDLFSSDDRSNEARIETLRSESQPYAIFDEDGLPYCSSKSLLLAFVANSQGRYIVGGDHCRLETYASYQELLSDRNVCVTARADEARDLNNAFGRTGKRKVRIEMRLDPRSKTIELRYSAQQKHLFWWSRCTTDIHGRLIINSLTRSLEVVKPQSSRYLYTLIGINGSRLPSPFVVVADSYDVEIGIDATNVSEHIAMFGRFVLDDVDENDGFSSVKIKMKGVLEAWSTGVPYASRGVSNVEIEM